MATSRTIRHRNATDPINRRPRRGFRQIAAYLYHLLVGPRKVVESKRDDRRIGEGAMINLTHYRSLNGIYSRACVSTSYTASDYQRMRYADSKQLGSDMPRATTREPDSNVSQDLYH